MNHADSRDPASLASASPALDSSPGAAPQVASEACASGPFRRLVSLVPSTTETIAALGLADRLVGVTDYCERPDPMPGHVVRVGGPQNPDLARIRELEPDLVLADREENRPADLAALTRWTRVHVAAVATVAEALLEIAALGELLDRPRPARRIVDRAAQAVLAVRQAARPFRYVYLVWYDPLMAAGPDTYISDFLGLGGGENVLAGVAASWPARYPVIDLKDLAAWRPDYVFLPDEPFRFDDGHAAYIAAQLGTRWHGRCCLVSGANHCWPGVRLLEGLAAYLAWLRDATNLTP